MSKVDMIETLIEELEGNRKGLEEELEGYFAVEDIPTHFWWLSSSIAKTKRVLREELNNKKSNPAQRKE